MPFLPNQLTAEADRIEDALARDEHHDGARYQAIFEESEIDMLADNMAVVTVGATRTNMGIMTACNGAACKLFGYPRWQVRRMAVYTWEEVAW